MQDPSYGVPAHLLPHVHLISDFRFPVLHSLNPEQIIEYLTNAPRIVKEVQPMSWQYLAQPPPDGTLLLVWQPEAQRGTQSASDGYLYADAEQSFQQPIAGYTIEILAHRQAWRPRAEPATAHSRMRYRILAKSPQVPGPNPDTSLWLVHYTSLPPQHRLPTMNLRLNPQQHNEIRERSMLEQSGQLPRRPFMLHDRTNWPHIQTQPHQRMQQPNPMYPSQMQMAGGPMRGPQGQVYPPQQQAAMGQPPAKRMRQAGPGQMPGMGGPGMQPPLPGMAHDPFLEEEENVAMGDLLDHLTPRDISIVRYTQHHEWMEEIFSSPYSASQIVPIDLGLGLSGELAELTNGILNAPDDKFVMDEAKHSASPYKKLSQAQNEDFERRVNGYVEKAEKDLARMREEHARTLAALKRGKTYMKAERQLKEVKNTSNNGDPDGPDPVDGIVAQVESTLGVKIGPRKDVVCIEKGGLIEEVAKPEPPPTETAKEENGTEPNGGANGVPETSTNGLANGSSGFDSGNENMNTDNEAADLLEEFGNGNSDFNTPGNNEANGTPGAAGGNQIDQEFSLEGIDEHSGGDADGMDLIDNMDLDIPELDGPAEDQADAAPTNGGDDWVMVDETAGTANANATADPTPAEAQAVAARTTSPPSTEAAAAVLDETVTQPATEAPSDANAAEAPAEGQAPETDAGNERGDALFDDDDFPNLDDSAGDALADFGEPDAGEDNAADAAAPTAAVENAAANDDDLADLGLGDETFDELGGEELPVAEEQPAAAVEGEPAVADALEASVAAPVTLGEEAEDKAEGGEGAA